jgi:hypothetical protein
MARFQSVARPKVGGANKENSSSSKEMKESKDKPAAPSHTATPSVQTTTVAEVLSIDLSSATAHTLDFSNAKTPVQIVLMNSSPVGKPIALEWESGKL